MFPGTNCIFYWKELVVFWQHNKNQREKIKVEDHHHNKSVYICTMILEVTNIYAISWDVLCPKELIYLEIPMQVTDSGYFRWQSEICYDYYFWLTVPPLSKKVTWTIEIYCTTRMLTVATWCFTTLQIHLKNIKISYHTYS